MSIKRLTQFGACMALVFTAVAGQSAIGEQALGTAPQPTDVARQTTPREPLTRHPEAVKALAALKSPYCHGLMLEVCTSSQGAALRDSIETMAEGGMSSDSIVSWVLANHGDTLLALPPVRGKGLIAWFVPPVAVVMGLGMVVVALRRMRRKQPAVELGEDLTTDQKKELEDALHELEAEEEAPLF